MRKLRGVGSLTQRAPVLEHRGRVKLRNDFPTGRAFEAVGAPAFVILAQPGAGS